MSSLHYSELCRLCLVNERVSIPIFDGESGIQSLCLKIGTCLPIKVSPEDILPKNICNDCFYKVENQYQFWISTANAEKQLLQWFSNAAPIPETDKGLAAMAAEQTNFKTEMDLDPSAELSKSLSQVEAVLAGETTNVPEKEDDEEEDESEEEGSNSDDSDYDGENAEGDGAKDDGDTDEAYDEELEPTTFVNVSFECDEAGPSGTQQQKQQRAPSAPSTSTSAPAPSGFTMDKQHVNISSPHHRESVIQPAVKWKSGTCKVCNVAWSGHSVTIEGVDRTQCCECKRVYDDIRALRRHHHTHVAPAERTCTICNKILSSKSVLQLHMAVHIEGRAFFTCKICSKTFRSEKYLKFHNKACYPFNNESFNPSSDNLLVDDTNRTHVTNIRQCKICGKGFNLERNLKIHMERRVCERTFACDICGKPYSNRQLVNNHRRSHNPDKPALKPVQCYTCGKVLSCPSALRMHRKSHTGENVHVCDVCGKTVTSRESLKSHRLLHTDEFPFECDVCHKGFKKASCLRIHRRIHSGIKPHSCKQCGKSFTQRSTLVVHLRYHSGERPYECHICNRAFVTKTLLKTHQKSHGTASADIDVSYI